LILGGASTLRSKGYPDEREGSSRGKVEEGPQINNIGRDKTAGPNESRAERAFQGEWAAEDRAAERKRGEEGRCARRS